MEMKYILYSRVHKTTDAGETWTFKFQPVDEKSKKMLSFSVTTTDPYRDMGTLDLPQTIGDIIVLGTSKKNVQKKIGNGGKK